MNAEEKQALIKRARELKAEGKWTMEQIKQKLTSEFSSSPNATTLSTWMRKGVPKKKSISMHETYWNVLEEQAQATNRSVSQTLESVVEGFVSQLPKIEAAHPKTIGIYQLIEKDIATDYQTWAAKMKELDPSLSQKDIGQIIKDLARAGIFYRTRDGFVLASRKREATLGAMF